MVYRCRLTNAYTYELVLNLGSRICGMAVKWASPWESEGDVNILAALKSEASKLQQQLDTLNSAIKALGGRNSVGRGVGRKKWHMSASAKARISRAQKARWAKVRAARRNA